MILKYGKATRRSRRCARLNSLIQRRCGVTSPNLRKRSLPQKAEFESWTNPARYSFPWGSRPRVFSIQPEGRDLPPPGALSLRTLRRPGRRSRRDAGRGLLSQRQTLVGPAARERRHAGKRASHGGARKLAHDEAR